MGGGGLVYRNVDVRGCVHVCMSVCVSVCPCPCLSMCVIVQRDIAALKCENGGSGSRRSILMCVCLRVRLCECECRIVRVCAFVCVRLCVRVCVYVRGCV